MSGSSAVQTCPSFAAHSGVNARAEGGARTEAGLGGKAFIVQHRNERGDANDAK